MGKKRVGPPKDGSVLLAVYNPFGVCSSWGGGAELGSKTVDIREARSRLCRTLRWFSYLGLETQQLYYKRTELCIIINVEGSDPEKIEHSLGMHLWGDYLDPCPPTWANEVSHIYRCVSTSVQHLELSLGFSEYTTFDPSDPKLAEEAKTKLKMSFPKLPRTDAEWPARQSGLTLYIRPRNLPDQMKTADDFLSSLGLPLLENSATPNNGNSEASTSTFVKAEPTEEDDKSLIAELLAADASRSSSIMAPPASATSSKHPQRSFTEEPDFIPLPSGADESGWDDDESSVVKTEPADEHSTIRWGSPRPSVDEVSWFSDSPHPTSQIKTELWEAPNRLPEDTWGSVWPTEKSHDTDTEADYQALNPWSDFTPPQPKGPPNNPSLRKLSKAPFEKSLGMTQSASTSNPTSVSTGYASEASSMLGAGQNIARSQTPRMPPLVKRKSLLAQLDAGPSHTRKRELETQQVQDIKRVKLEPED